MTAISAGEALALVRRQVFDALVVECEADALNIPSFIGKVQGVQPSLAVLAATWADDLAGALDDLGHEVAMLAKDESVRLAAENQMA